MQNEAAVVLNEPKAQGLVVSTRAVERDSRVRQGWVDAGGSSDRQRMPASGGNLPFIRPGLNAEVVP